MARAHYVKKARKTIKGTVVVKGQPYYWWAFRYGGKHVSLTPPKPSQLTQSEFKSEVLALGEELAELKEKAESAVSDLKSKLEEAASRLSEIGDECQSKISNIEDKFPNGNATTELLNARAEFCEQLASELEAIEVEEPDLSEIDNLTWDTE